MCLIVFAWKVIPGMPLIVAANRDEYYHRPTAPAGWWEDHPDIYAGKDLQGGGTWMGVTKDGRFAALTNIRKPDLHHCASAPTRGKLVSDYLSGTCTPEDYIQQIAQENMPYNGYNLLVGNRDTLLWYSNHGTSDPRNGQPLNYGIYGLSNDLLDTPWPKVTRAKAQFASLLCQGAPEETFFEMLGDRTLANDCRLPKTGVSTEFERILSSVFIASDNYGTRASSVVLVPIAGVPSYTEHVFSATVTTTCPVMTDHAPKQGSCCPKPC